MRAFMLIPAAPVPGPEAGIRAGLSRNRAILAGHCDRDAGPTTAACQLLRTRTPGYRRQGGNRKTRTTLLNRDHPPQPGGPACHPPAFALAISCFPGQNATSSTIRQRFAGLSAEGKCGGMTKAGTSLWKRLAESVTRDRFEKSRVLIGHLQRN